MGEYATHNNDEVKIGTCSSMYYLRFEDREKVSPLSGNVNPMVDKGLLYRLPFPDEDGIGIGYYQPFLRGYRLYKKVDGHYQDFTDPVLVNSPGSIQMKHECGLLVSVPCYHGAQLPDLGEGVRVHWNGKSWFIELVFVKEMNDGTMVPVIHCRHCRNMWNCEWDEVKDYLHGEIRERLSKHWK